MIGRFVFSLKKRLILSLTMVLHILVNDKNYFLFYYFIFIVDNISDISLPSPSLCTPKWNFLCYYFRVWHFSVKWNWNIFSRIMLSLIFPGLWKHLGPICMTDLWQKDKIIFKPKRCDKKKWKQNKMRKFTYPFILSYLSNLNENK